MACGEYHYLNWLPPKLKIDYTVKYINPSSLGARFYKCSVPHRTGNNTAILTYIYFSQDEFKKTP